MSPMFSLVFSGVSIMMVVAGFFMFYRAFGNGGPSAISPSAASGSAAP